MALPRLVELPTLLIITFLATLALPVTGCFVHDRNEHRSLPCSTEWYLLVEQLIPTGDQQGHGPDPGSAEWRSVIEFKLGIRGDTGVPPLDTDQWCEFIDTHYIWQQQ